MMKVAASVAELEIPTTAIRHGRLILRKTRKKGESVCFSSNNNHFEFESVPLNGSSPRKVRKRLIINSIKKKKEDGLLGLNWLERIGASNTTSTTRDIPHVQVLSEWYRVEQVLEKRGMISDSMGVLKRIVLADHKQEKAWLRIVDLHKSKGERLQAVTVLKAALSVHPTCGSLWCGLANIARESSCYQQACLLYIKAAQRLGKGTTSPWSAWGWMEIELGNFHQARKVLETGIVQAKKRKLKEDPGLWYSYGVLMDQCGQSAVALEAFRRGLKVSPTDLRLRTAHGIVLYRSGHIKEAKRVFRNVLRIQRTHPEASFCLGYLEESEGNFYGARLFYEASTSSVAIASENDLSPLGLMALARMELRRKNFDRAVEVYSDAASLFPFNPDILSDWANAEALRGDDAVAQSLFERASMSTKDKKTAKSLKKAALFEFKRGQTTRGRILLFRAVLNTVSDEDLFLILPTWAEMEWQLGNQDRARLAMQFAVRLWDGKPKQANVLKAWSKLEYEDGNLALASHLSLHYVNVVGGDDAEALNILAKIAGKRGELESQRQYVKAERRALQSERKQPLFQQHRDLYAEMAKF